MKVLLLLLLLMLLLLVSTICQPPTVARAKQQQQGLYTSNMDPSIAEEQELIRKAEQEPPMRAYLQEKLEKEAQRNWDLFYKRHATHFFKDRHWIMREFPDLAPTGAVSV